MRDVTDEQIEILRSEASQAGDTLQVALCDVALASGLTDMAEVGEHRVELETLGIVPEHVDADVKAREFCAKAIADAQVRTTLEEKWWAWHDENYHRMYATVQEAVTACQAWVRGESDVGPDRDHDDEMSMSQAEQIAEQLCMDGQVWETKTNQSLDDLCEAAHGVKTYKNCWGSDSYKYKFRDGSVITCHGAGWDLGYLDCWCWAGFGHDENCFMSTHTIFLEGELGREEIPVRLVDGAAYTREEWSAEVPADWTYDEEHGWRFHGDPCPPGFNNVQVIEGDLGDYPCSTRLALWVIERRCCLDTDQGDDDRTIAAGLGNGAIPIPEWMGVREECHGVWVWDTAESSGGTHLLWLGVDDEQAQPINPPPKMTSVLSQCIQGHPSYRTEPGILLADWVDGCRHNSQSPEDIIATQGNYRIVELQEQTDGCYLVWVEGACRSHWLTWEELDDLEAEFNQQ
jgi:hypothetical protein